MTAPKALILGVLGLLCVPLCAQESSPRSRLLAARAQYYTPTARGLQSFHCDAAIDWKAMLTRMTGKDIGDDNPGLQFLRTVNLSVVDDLKGNGSLEWTNTVPLPVGKEEGLNQVREGLQTSVGGFFQSWNAYMNGSMVLAPDSTVTVTAGDAGLHVSGLSQGMKIDEDFDKNMLLTQIFVLGPNIKVQALPTYTTTPDGLVISAVTSRINQPPTAAETEATFRIDYAKVDAFQIPSRIVFDIKNTGVIEVGLNNCKIHLAEWANKP